MKFRLAVMFAALAMAATAAEPVTNVVNITKLSRAERAKLKDLFSRYEGGRIAKPGSKRGKIVCINAQSRAKPEWIREQISDINQKLHYDIEFKNGEFALPSPKVEGEANLFVIDDPIMPSLLSAPENRWAMVNVAGLVAGDGAKPQFFEARVKKELTRGFCLVAGAQDSGFKMSLMGCMTKPEQLDTHADCRLPIDVIKRFRPYLEGYGIRPEKIVTYRKACEEGWAPQPTNDIQRAVWNDVHAIPDKPITIEFDPKKDTTSRL